MEVIAVVAFSLAVVASAPTGDGELAFVTFIHRHGDRSPVTTYLNDPHWNESFWNNGWGELTNTGKRTAYALGKWLRSRYNGFLPEIYNKHDYEAESTDVSRTLMSAYLVLAGLYEPRGSDVWEAEIRWQPIPVHTTPAELDNVLAGGKPCQKRTQLFTSLAFSPDFFSLMHPLEGTLSEVVQLAGYNSTNIFENFLTAAMIYDSLKVQHENGLILPEWSKQYFPKPLQSVNSLMLNLWTFNKPLQRLSCGLLVRNILHNLKSKAAGVLEKKMWQYSAHDSTIVGLRNCLGFNETDSPPYGSALIIELRRNNVEYYVEILYKSKDVLRKLVIPGCSEVCLLGEFEELVRPVIPEDWERECGNS